MGNLNDILADWETEHNITKAVLESIKGDKLSYRPHEKSRSLAELAWHLVTSPMWFGAEAMRLDVKLDVDSEKTPETVQEVLKSVDKVYIACKEAVRSRSDKWLSETSDFLGQQLPHETIISWMIRHEIHHRGQLSVYLRLVGSKVPSIYGPSADDEETRTLLTCQQFFTGCRWQ